MTKKKLKKLTSGEKGYIFNQQLQFTLPFASTKERPSYSKSLHPSKENIQHFKTCNFSTFSICVGNFFALLDPNSNPTESGSTTVKKR
jgi:hypothetical protein